MGNESLEVDRITITIRILYFAYIIILNNVSMFLEIIIGIEIVQLQHINISILYVGELPNIRH